MLDVKWQKNPINLFLAIFGIDTGHKGLNFCTVLCLTSFYTFFLHVFPLFFSIADFVVAQRSPRERVTYIICLFATYHTLNPHILMMTRQDRKNTNPHMTGMRYPT